MSENEKTEAKNTEVSVDVFTRLEHLAENAVNFAVGVDDYGALHAAINRALAEV